MKKKVLSFMFAFILIVSMTGCSSGVPQEDYDALKSELDSLKSQMSKEDNSSSVISVPSSVASVPEEQATPDKKAFNSDEVLSQIEFTELGSYVNIINTTYSVFTLKNNSEFLLDININITFSDESGGTIGAKSEDLVAIAPGQEIALPFGNENNPASHSETISVKQSSFFGDAWSNLSWDVATTESKAIVTVKNNGDVPAEFVQCTAIFYYDGEIIGHTNKFCIDNDSEIKPGSSISEELSSYEPFTDVKIFVTGRT